MPDPNPSIAPPPAKFVLWSRRHSRERWRAVAGAATEAELTARLAELPSGDYLTLPLDQDPNRSQRPR